MNTKFKGRLEQLEEAAEQLRQRASTAILQAALATVSSQDIELVAEFLQRHAPFQQGTLDQALAKCTPEEAAAIERCNAASEAAARKINGRPLSASEANRILIRPGSLRDDLVTR